MKGIIFKPEIWQAKLQVLEKYGKAVTRRAEAGLKGYRSLLVGKEVKDESY